MQVEIVRRLNGDVIPFLDLNIFCVTALFHLADGLPCTGGLTTAAIFCAGIAYQVAVVFYGYCHSSVVKVTGRDPLALLTPPGSTRW